MTLDDGLHAVPDGMLAAVVTHLAMTAPPPDRPAPLPDGMTLRHVEWPDADWYRDLFERVGSRDHLWISRLALTRDALEAILGDPEVEVRALEAGGRAEGLVELDFREAGTCELAFFGATRAMRGRGAGRAMMAAATARAFDRGVSRLTVHTCTLDAPAALPFYLRAGFVPVRREVEVFADPRLSGLLPQAFAPLHPMIAPG